MAFFEFNIAMSGLFAAQRGLSVTSNNITNANTKGYSRQVLGQQADTPLSGIGVGMTGTGVATTNVSRVRDSYLDNKLWSQSDRLGEYNIKVAQNSIIEGVFGEPSDSGFTTVFNNMFTSIDSLSQSPSSGETKAALKQNMISYTKYYNSIATSLSNYQQDLNYELKAKVDEINTLAGRIQSLNSQVFQAEIHGDEANNFRDERDLCVDRLSELINVEAKETEINRDGKTFKTFSVKVAGQSLVDHTTLRELDITVRADGDKLNAEDLDGLYDVVWKDGLEFDMSDSNMSGELKGIIDMRDGCGVNGEVSYNGIPYYIKRMDEYVREFAKTMNEEYSKDSEGYIHVTGPGIDFIKKEDDGSTTYYKLVDGKKEVITPTAPATSIDYQVKYQLFTYSDGTSKAAPEENPDLKNNDYSKMTAANLSISKQIYDDKIRTTYGHDPLASNDTNPDPSDTSFLLNLSSQKNNKDMFKEGDPKDYMVAIFSELGISAQEAQMHQSTQTSVTNNIKNQRLSVSQVETTEEFTNLIKYQQAYQAAAKIMNVIDGIYDTTIFKLGNF